MAKKQSDKDLKQQIKEMEAKKRAEVLSTAEVRFINPESEDNKVSYDQWWMVANKKLKLRNHLKEIILADFKGRGLSTLETMEKYNHACNLFGYKI